MRAPKSVLSLFIVKIFPNLHLPFTLQGMDPASWKADTLPDWRRRQQSSGIEQTDYALV